MACEPDAPMMPPVAAPSLFPRPSRSESTRGSALLARFDCVKRVSSVEEAEASQASNYSKGLRQHTTISYMRELTLCGPAFVEFERPPAVPVWCVPEYPVVPIAAPVGPVEAPVFLKPCVPMT